MNNLKIAISLFLGLALAGDISLQAFDSPDCGGTAIANVHPNAANPHDSSGCIATSKFSSVAIISGDEGFNCNVYADNACSNFLLFLTKADVTGCSNVIGSGITCFSQALFDNPFAESTAVVTLGKSNIVTSTGGDTAQFVANAISTACGDTGCDPSTKTTTSFRRNTDCNDNVLGTEICNTRKDCSQAVTVTGNYDNTNQRDYISSVIQLAMEKGSSGVSDPFTPGLANLLSFSQVVVNDPKGNNQAEMTVSIDVACDNVNPGDSGCDGILGTLTSAALGAIPEVGGIIAALFEVTCQAVAG